MRTSFVIPGFARSALLPASAATIAIGLWIAQAASAQITIVNTAGGFLGSNKAQVTTVHNGSEQVTYDATGVAKLVVSLGAESGFNNQQVTNLQVSFNGVPMTQAVFGNTRGVPTNDCGGAAIFFLDNPFQGSATFSVTFAATSGGANGGRVAIVGLAGTAPGVGSTSASWTTQASAGNVSTSLNTSAQDSLVIAMVQNSGSNNASGTPNVIAPLTLVSNGVWGNQWGSAATGRQFVPAAGSTVTTTFSTNAAGNIQIVAAEFTLAVPTLYWDVNGDTAGAGGPVATGVWDASTPNWNPNADGTDPTVAWSPSATAVFAAGNDATDPFIVEVSGAQVIGGLIFQEGTVTLAAGTSGSLSLEDSSPVNVGSELTATVGTPITEANPDSGVIKVGSGTLVLSGDLSFTGPITTSTGTLVLSGNNAAATGGMVLNGGLTRFDSLASISGTGDSVLLGSAGTMLFGPDFDAANIPAALQRVIDTSNGAIAVDNYPATTFNLNSAGLGAAFLGAVGTVEYSGTITPAGGIYRLGGGGGTLVMTEENAVTGSGTSLVVRGDVTLVKSNAFDGGTTLDAGTLALGHDASLGSGGLAIHGGRVSSSGTDARTIANAISIGADCILGATANNGALTFNGDVNLGGATRGITLDSNVEIPSAISNGGINKSGTGVLELSGENTYTGPTAILGGALILSGGSSATSNVTVNNGQTLIINNAGALGSATITMNAGILDNTSGSAIAMATNNAFAFNNNFTFGTAGSTSANNLTFGPGVVTTNGNRTITMNGTATTLAFGGALRSTQNGNQTITVNGVGNTVVFGGYILQDANTTSRTNTIQGTGNMIMAAPVTNGQPASCGLIKAQTGTLTLQGVNTYTGDTTVNGGTLALVGGSQASPITVNNGAFLGFTLGSPTTSSAAVTLNAGSKIRITGTPVASSYTLITAASINGTPELESEIEGYDLVVESGTTLKLVGSVGPDYLAWAAKFPSADLSDPSADFDGDGLTNDQERIFGLDPTDGTSANPIVVPLDASVGTLSFTRRDPALTGLIYKVWYSTDLLGWEVDEDAMLTPGATVDEVQTVAVQLGEYLLDEPKLFIRIGAEEPEPPGPLFEADFEDGDGGFTVVGDPNDWAYGTPNSHNAAGLILTAGNDGSAKCWGTNLGTGGTPPSGVINTAATSRLRSPNIDLTGIVGAKLTFAAAYDTATGDTVQVIIRDAATDSPLGSPITPVPVPGTSDWTIRGPFDLSAGDNMVIYLEFRYQGTNSAYIGLYIDDVTVTP